MDMPAYNLIGVAATMLVVPLMLLRVFRYPAAAGRRLDAEMAAALLILLAAWRWPPLFSPIEFNPDESQLIAGALTLFHDPVFWRSVDGTTSGPLNFYALMPLLAFESIPPVVAARLTGLLLVWSALALTFALLRRAAGAAVAVLGLLPSASVLAATTDWDFIHYSSEHVSLPLIAGAALLLWAETGRPEPRGSWRWLLAALCAGLLPWAKPQSAPFAALFALTAVAVAAFTPRLAPKRRIGMVASFAGTSLSPTAFFLAMVLFTEQGAHFYQSYVLNNVAYTSAQSGVWSALEGLWEMSAMTWMFPIYLQGSLVILATGLLGGLTGGARPGWFYCAALAGTLTAVFTVLAPSLPFQHYLLYLVLPLCWLTAANLHLLWIARPNLRSAAMVCVLCAGVAAPVLVRLSLGYPGGFAAPDETDVSRDTRLAALAREFAEPGDRIAVWGWAPRIYADSRLPQGTRDGNTVRQIQLSPQRDIYYVPRYVDDLRRNRPVLFIDAVGPGAFFFAERVWNHHDSGSFPALADQVARFYTKVIDVHGARLYVRTDLIRDRPEATRRLEQATKTLAAKGQVPMALPEVGLPRRNVHRREVLHLQTPGEFALPLTGNETDFYFTFGMEPRAYLEGETNGAELRVELHSPGQQARLLFTRSFDPKRTPTDRGLLAGHTELPSLPAGSQLVVRALPGEFNNSAWDWVFVTELRFARRIATAR